jgi:hypothetical protein
MPGTNEGMNAARGAARPDDRPWGRHNLIPVNPAAGTPFSPQHLDYRHAGTRVKDAFGAADAAGLRPVLDPVRPAART